MNNSKLTEKFNKDIEIMGKHSMNTVTVGRHGRITIPHNIRHQFRLKEGDRIALVVQGDQIMLRPIRQTLLDLRGSVPVSGPQDFDATRNQIIGKRALR